MAARRQTEKLVGFDMDGVLIDHTALRIELARKWGVELAPKDTPSDIIRTVVPDEPRHAIQHAIYNDQSLALRAPLMAGADEGLARLSAERIPFVLISRRKDPSLAIRLMEVRGIWPRYFSEANAVFVITPEDKERKSAELGVTHYVDDEMKVLDALASVPYRILFDPHRAHQENKYPMIGDWETLVQTLIDGEY